MKTKDIYNLHEGETIGHKHYRRVKVTGIMKDNNGRLFGILIIPCFWRDRLQIASQSGMHPNVPLLEDNIKLLFKPL